jgi:hypothetical protein
VVYPTTPVQAIAGKDIFDLRTAEDLDLLTTVIERNIHVEPKTQPEQILPLRPARLHQLAQHQRVVTLTALVEVQAAAAREPLVL